MSDSEQRDIVTLKQGVLEREASASYTGSTFGVQRLARA